MSRHPSVSSLMKFLKPNPNLKTPQSLIAVQCESLAISMLDIIEDGPELATGLRKLLEAKDCFVRASLDLTKES